MSNYPKDRFDDLPEDLDRRGAHRAPRSRGAKIASWLWGLAAVAVLVTLGLIGMSGVDNIVSDRPTEEAQPTESAQPSDQQGQVPQEAEPQVDPNLTVDVYNGAGVQGAASTTAEKLSAAGWTTGELADADSQDNATTVVFYADAANEGAARKIVQDLGGGEIKLDPSQVEAGRIKVIVGTDVVQ